MASPSAVNDADHDAELQRRYKAPYTSHHPIPTIERYETEKQDRRDNSNQYVSPKGPSQEQNDRDAANRYLWSEEHEQKSSGDHGPDRQEDRMAQSSQQANGGAQNDGELAEDTSETQGAGMNLKQKRKALGKRKGDRAEREVTDPVTHLRVRIHDLQEADLHKVPENLAPPGSDPSTATGLGNKNKSDEELRKDTAEAQQYHRELENLFPPPEYDAVKQQLAGVYTRGITAALGMMAVVGSLFLAMERGLVSKEGGILSYMTGTSLIFAAMGSVVVIILGVRTWMENKITTVWEEELWHSQKVETRENAQSQDDGDVQESTHWLNNMLSSIWPLINPDLFVSLGDTLEVGSSLITYNNVILTACRTSCRQVCRALCAW